MKIGENENLDMEVKIDTLKIEQVIQYKYLRAIIEKMET